MTPGQTIEWQTAAITHRGHVRELNEDAYVALPESGVWAVADGMGGHHAGDVASRCVVDALRQVARCGDIDELRSGCRARLQEANSTLFEQGLQRNGQIIGSTVVVMASVGVQGAMLWAGDSRGYLLRDGHIQQLTTDHSRINELIERGDLEPELAEFHPEANVITRAVGVSDRLALDETAFTVATGDIILVCSDGLSRYLSEEKLKYCLNLPTASAAVSELLRLTLETDARDNISAVVLHAIEFDDTNTVLNVDELQQDDDKTVINKEQHSTS